MGTILLWTGNKQDGRSLSKELTSEKQDDTDKNVSKHSEKDSNTEEKGTGARQDYIGFLKVDLRHTSSTSKDELLDIAVKRMPTDVQELLKHLSTEEPSIVN